MNKKMTNKGYMLVEIILAFAIAFAILYFVMDLVINLKNKNDNLLVKALVHSDRAIITNELMSVSSEKKYDFDCNLLTIEGNTIKYNNQVINIVDDYATIENFDNTRDCVNDDNKISIKIPISVKQLPDENFDVSIQHRYKGILTAYAIYSESSTENALIFYQTYDKIEVGDVIIINGEEIKVTKIYTGFEEPRYLSEDKVPWYEVREQVDKIVFANNIQPKATAYWFTDFVNVKYIDVSMLDTSRVEKMNHMFQKTGYNSTNLEIIGINYWDTSNVNEINHMFHDFGYNDENFYLDVSGLVTNKTISLERVFNNAGYNSKSFKIEGLNTWNTSTVDDMVETFANSGYSATNWDIGDISNWDVSNVTNMWLAFSRSGYNANNFSIDISNWDVSNVTDFTQLIMDAGHNATNWSIGDISNWDVSSATNMHNMFCGACYSCNSIILDLSKWNVSNVTNMHSMFYETGYNANTFKITGLANWNDKIKNVTFLSYMFAYAGHNSSVFDIGNISGWNITNVTDMYRMFYYTGTNAPYSINLSSWQVPSTMDLSEFNKSVESKVTLPTVIS